MDVWCEICGHEWDSRDPGVRYVYGWGQWECYDEVACFTRLAAAREAMRAGQPVAAAPVWIKEAMA